MQLKNSIVIVVFFVFGIFSFSHSQAQQSQPQVQTYAIAGISVEGNKFADAGTIISLSGLRVGDQITLPGDNKIPLAIRNLWQRKQFSDVDIFVEKNTPLGIFLKIRVREFKRLSEIAIENNKELKDEDVKKAIGKVPGDILSPYEVYLSRKNLKKKYKEEGYMFAKIETHLKPTEKPDYAQLRVLVYEGVEYHVEKITFTGNKAYTNSDLESALDKTHSKSWWQFWRSSKFDLAEYDKDKEALANFYKKNGFRDFELIKDTLIYDEKDDKLYIEMKVNEGPKLFVRNINFTGNTTFPSENLIKRLEFKTGDVYNYEKFQQNLTVNQEQTDATSLYLDNGYLFARLEPEEKRIGDSTDINITVYEGDRVTIRKVDIIGNNKTKDKVIRRELYTRPGDFFNRSAIIRSIRALGVLNYFNPEALKPDVKPVDKTKVDVVYKVEERSTDTFNASVGYAGSFGFTGAVGITLNNFALTEPLKGGGGQMFNFNWEFGQSNRWQNISFGLSEPWVFDEPTTVGFNLYDSRINYNYTLRRTGFQVNLGRRFRWPDDYFRGDVNFRVQRNDVGTSGAVYYRPGINTELTVGTTISRISLDNMMFPTSGSKFSLSGEWAMGAIGIGTTDYFKAGMNLALNEPLMQINGMNRLVLTLSTNWGYISGFKSDTTIPPIDLYYMGGNGLSGFGVTPLRGYADRAIGPSTGGKVFSKHVAEIRFGVSVDPMPIYVGVFAEAGNVWNNFRTTDPFNLKRSAGVSLQLFINPIGLIGFSYGYGFDKADDTGDISGWKFLFHLGNF